MTDEPATSELTASELAASELAALAPPRLARRGFVMTGLISGLTLATVRVEAQTIHTSAAGLDVAELHIPVADGRMPAYMARPQGAGPFPTVLVIEEIFGVHEYIKDVCRRLAKLGYLAVAPELYAREGDLTQAMTVAQTSAIVNRAPEQQINSDLDATVAWAARNRADPARLGVTGFCRGGRLTWLYAAHSTRPKAAVAWYGPFSGPTSKIEPRSPMDVVGRINCPVLGLYAGLDPSTTPAQIAEAEARAKAAGKTVQFVSYPDAMHGFHADYRPSYNGEDAADGWARMLAWFRRYGVA